MSKDIPQEGIGEEQMKQIIILTLITLLILSGCGSKETEVCNYQPFIDQNTNLMNQNTQCQTDRNLCNIDLIEYKNVNNQLKLQLLNNNSNDCVPTSCNTVVRLLTRKKMKKRIEDLLSSTQRKGMENVLKFLDEGDFYTAPASSKFHGSSKGGLATHAL